MPGPPTVPKLNLGVLKTSSKIDTGVSTRRSQVGSRSLQKTRNSNAQWSDDFRQMSSRCYKTEVDGFLPQTFLGIWEDNLGRSVTVTPYHTQRCGRVVFTARFQCTGDGEKTFTISKDDFREWMCGSGCLLRNESSTDVLAWRAVDGQWSKWTRAAKATVRTGSPVRSASDNWPALDSSRIAKQPSHKSPRTPPRSSASERVPLVDNVALTTVPRLSLPSGATTQKLTPREFFHMGTPDCTPVVRLQPQSSVSHEIEMLQNSPDVCLLPGGGLEWELPDSWANLGTLPRGFCVSSPIFGIEQAPTLQLVFYPNGNGISHQNRSTVTLLRGPNSQGVKFDLKLNGISIGQQLSVSHQHHCDFALPFDMVEGCTGKVEIGFQVLDTFAL